MANTIHETVEALLLKRAAKSGNRYIGLTYKEILRIVRRKFPRSAVNDKHISWYASRLRAHREKLPFRPRARWTTA